MACDMTQNSDYSIMPAGKEAVSVGDLFYICTSRIPTLHSIELPKAKNCISALFPGEIINHIYRVRDSPFETHLTFLGPGFS